MTVMYLHLQYEDYKNLEKQMKEFKETSHTSTGGFYHKSIRLQIDEETIMEFHGPLVGGYGHAEDEGKDEKKPPRQHPLPHQGEHDWMA